MRRQAQPLEAFSRNAAEKVPKVPVKVRCLFICPRIRQKHNTTSSRISSRGRALNSRSLRMVSLVPRQPVLPLDKQWLALRCMPCCPECCLQRAQSMEAAMEAGGGGAAERSWAAEGCQPGCPAGCPALRRAAEMLGTLTPLVHAAKTGGCPNGATDCSNSAGKSNKCLIGGAKCSTSAGLQKCKDCQGYLSCAPYPDATSTTSCCFCT